ncbi:MAG: hypothetical protein ACRCRR_03000, partial [Rickettsia sp.]
MTYKLPLEASYARGLLLIGLCSEGYLLLFFRRNYPILTAIHLPKEFHKLIILVITIASRFCDA